MGHLHSVHDTDAHLKINAITRVITNASSGKTVLIQCDHNSERFTFEVPRVVDGHDLSKCNVVQIHYINIDSANKANTSTGVYEADDLQISPDSDDVVILSWLISSNATKYAGSLNFLVKFKCVDDSGEVVYVWNTAIYTGISVSSGIDNGETVVEEYADVLEQWRQKLVESGGNGLALPNFLHGLKYYAFGDSIVDMQGTLTAPETFGDTGYTTDMQKRNISDITVNGYVTAIEQRFGLVATNYGKGGQTLVGGYATLAALDYSDVALVTIAYGVNDARTGVPLGTVNSEDITTFAGALNMLLRKIYTDNPECRVVVLTPIQRLYVSEFGIATPNANGNYLVDFVEMCKKVAEKRSTTCIDMYHGCGLNQTNLDYYTVEGVHPVNQGFARMRNAIIPVLDGLFVLEYNPFRDTVEDDPGDEPGTGGGGTTEPGEPEPDVPVEPPVEDTDPVVVDLAALMVNNGYNMDGWGTGANNTNYKYARYHPEANKTYTIVTYGEARLNGEPGDGVDRRQWSYTFLNEDGSVKSGNYLGGLGGYGHGSANTYEPVTINGVEYAKMTATFVTNSTVADNYYWNIPCHVDCIDLVTMSYI